MINAATDWLVAVEIDTNFSDNINNVVSLVCIYRYPWPTKVICEKVKEANNIYGFRIIWITITTRDSQVNAVSERVYQTLRDTIKTFFRSERKNTHRMNSNCW